MVSPWRDPFMNRNIPNVAATINIRTNDGGVRRGRGGTGFSGGFCCEGRPAG
jgi:hypothetical protein